MTSAIGYVALLILAWAGRKKIDSAYKPTEWEIEMTLFKEPTVFVAVKMKPYAFLLAVALAGSAIAQAPTTPPVERQAATEKKAPAQKDIIFGHQLMTDAERAEYRAKMRALKTPEEREAFRAEHHKLMQERAKERGVTLPEMPPHGGMGQGHMSGPGMRGKKGPQQPGQSANPPSK